jgi:thiol:disulfide interchange protein
MKNNKAVPTLTKTFLLLIFLCNLAFSVTAQAIPNNAEPLAPEDAFVMDYIVVGPSEAVIRWQISKYYYLYKEKFAFSSKDFIIENVQFPRMILSLAQVKFTIMWWKPPCV